MNIVEVYNPANAANLTDEQISAMRTLTVDEIAQLAKAYPNGPTGNSYLKLHDKNLGDEKQIYPLSTWQNLHNLHKINNFNFTAFAFTKNFVAPVANNTSTVPARVLDLGLDEIAGAEGLKKTNVPVVDMVDGEKGKDEIAGAEGSGKKEGKTEQATNYEAAVTSLEEAKKAGAHKHIIKTFEEKVKSLEAK